MTIKNTEEFIYESPDGGNTIYCRRIGEVNRHVLSINSQIQHQQKLKSRWLNLKEAVYMADTDKALNDALEKVEILYALKKTED